MKTHIVITSIFAPTTAVNTFASFSANIVIVVGDKKSPATYECQNVKFLSCDDQQVMDSSLEPLLPYNHYCRKMMGYIFAIRDGAFQILDTDDDNIPKTAHEMPAFSGIFPTIRENLGFVNIYEFFSNEKVWPRGLPLHLINSTTLQKEVISSTHRQVGVWQGLADGDPDVDAIYRLTNGSLIEFNNAGPIVLNPGTVCPFNSQNTLFQKRFFSLLYLPTTVTFRYTDILRGIVAQPIMWAAGFCLGFFDATVIQERNVHDYMRDFEQEVPMYLTIEKALQICTESVRNEDTIEVNLLNCYSALAAHGIVKDEELLTLRAWLADITI